MNVNDLWVLKDKNTGNVITAAERCDPIAVFTSEADAKNHAEWYFDADDGVEPVKLVDA